MDINLLENSEKEIRKSNLEIEKNVNELSIQKQNNFINSILGQSINKAMDIGIKSILPDYIEDIVINIKDTIMTEGFEDGIKTIINSAIDVGKSAIGIFTGNFENIEQLESAMKKGGIIDKVSELLDNILEDIKDKELLDKSTIKLIKDGKNEILNNIDINIEDTMSSQIKSVEKISKYSSSWNSYYLKNDFNGMEKEYKKMQKELNKIIPLENTIKKCREIENIHNLIKNNGNNFDITKEELELAKKLV